MRLFANIPKDKRQKMVLVGLGAVAAVAAAVQFHLGRECRSYFSAKSEVNRLTSEISDTTRRQQELQANNELRRQFQEFVDAQQAAMVHGDAFAWVVREISLLVDAHPIRVLSLRPGGDAGQARGAKGPVVYTTRLEIAGQYDEIGRFIRDLENKFPTAEIRSLELTGNTSGTGGHQANLELSIMVRPEPAKPRNPEQAAS